jgi:hypothetical protein
MKSTKKKVIGKYLLFSQDKKYISVSSEEKPDCICVKIEDNGTIDLTNEENLSLL